MDTDQVQPVRVRVSVTAVPSIGVCRLAALFVALSGGDPILTPSRQVECLSAGAEAMQRAMLNQTQQAVASGVGSLLQAVAGDEMEGGWCYVFSIEALNHVKCLSLSSGCGR